MKTKHCAESKKQLSEGNVKLGFMHHVCAVDLIHCKFMTCASSLYLQLRVRK